MKAANKYFVFIFYGLFYCVPIDNVVEVLQIEEFVSSPLKFQGFSGYADFRNKLAPVLNIAVLVDNAVILKPQPKIKSVVIMQISGQMFGLQIDKFIESIDIDEMVSSETNEEANKKIIDKIYKFRNQALAKINISAIFDIVKQTFSDYNEKNDNDISDDSSVEREKEEMELFCFKIENLKFGLPITDVLEIIEGYSVAPLFNVPSALRGLINLRGQIIACFDISESLGLTKRTLFDNNKFIIIQHGDYDIGLCIDAVAKIKRFLPEEIQSGGGIPNISNEFITGVIERQNERIFIISPKNILKSKILADYI